MRRPDQKQCARCGKTNYKREKGPNGCTRCIECGYSQLTSGWDTGELGPFKHVGEDVTGPTTDSLDDGRDYGPLVSHMAAKMLHRLEAKRAQNNGWLDDHHDTATTTQNVVEKMERKLEVLRGRALHHAQMFHADDRCDAFGLAADIANLAAILAELAEGPITDPPTRSIIVDMQGADILDHDELFSKVMDAIDPSVLERLASPVLNAPPPAPDRILIADNRVGGALFDVPRRIFASSAMHDQTPNGLDVALVQLTCDGRGVASIWVDTMEDAKRIVMKLRTASAIVIEDSAPFDTCTIT